MLLIVDIDGTLSDYSHRLYLIEKENVSENDFKAFLAPELVKNDPPYPNAKEGLSKLKQQAFKMYFITSRNENLRTITKEWLYKHMGINVPNEYLIMRQGCFGLATTHKSNMFIKHIVPLKHQYPQLPLIFVDDDPHVLHFYSNHGLTLKAPECWDLIIHPKPTEPEVTFNK